MNIKNRIFRFVAGLLFGLVFAVPVAIALPFYIAFEAATDEDI